MNYGLHGSKLVGLAEQLAGPLVDGDGGYHQGAGEFNDISFAGQYRAPSGTIGGRKRVRDGRGVSA